MNFIDYCFLGITEFKDNCQIDYFYLALVVLSLVLIGIKFFKTRNKNISYFYLLAYLTIIYPLIETYHASLFLFFLFIVFIYNTEIRTPKKIVLYSFIIIILFILTYDYFDELNIYHYHNYPIVFLSPTLKKDYDYIIDLNKKHRIIFVADPSTLFYSTCDKKLDKYYILYKGNQGSGGVESLIQNIKDEHDVYFVVSNTINWDDEYCQIDARIPKMIRNDSKLFYKLSFYSIYYKE
jgi:hypothetical protein